MSSNENLTVKYQVAINQIIDIFKDNEVITEYGDQPENELRDYINTIETIYANQKEINYDLAMRSYIKNLKCWRWRFVNQTHPGDVWNPLYEPFQQFTERCNNQFDHWFDDVAFPNDIIIENWIKSHVEKSGSKTKTTHRPTT